LCSQWVRHLDDGSINFIEGIFSCDKEKSMHCGFCFVLDILLKLWNSHFLFAAGARQPTYLVTADDVDFVLAIEVQPLDDKKRKVYLHITC
jgi:hypothetical protein